jgi:hypothetical protein
MTAPNEKHPWQQLVDRKATELIEHLAATYAWVKEHGNSDPEFFRDMAADQLGWLRELYLSELPLAKMLDESDLVLELEGPALRLAHPKISLVTRTFSHVQKQVNSVAKTIAGQPPSQKRFRLSQDMELGFTELARNTGLRFGFTIPDPPSPGESLLGEHDPMFMAVRDAVRAIREFSVSVGEVEGQGESAIAEHAKDVFQDPRLRDAALVAVKELAPTQRGGVASVRVGGRGVEIPSVCPMTVSTRKSLAHLMATPVRGGKEFQARGEIREMDLDAKRFDLRGIAEGQQNDLRCVYGKDISEPVAKTWLGRPALVEGKIERDQNGKPRLLQIVKMKISGLPDSEQSEFEFVSQ